MHFTLLVAGALLPRELAVALSASLDVPNLKARLARATLATPPLENAARSASESAGGNAHLDWLARKLFSHPMPAPTAPYAYAQLSGSAPHACMWHAEPIHVSVARDHLIVHALGAALPARKSQELMRVANELASGSSCKFVAAGDRWFLQSEHDWSIDAAPLAAAIESPVVMPTGKDAHTWNRLHNEIQMAWHAHPVNQLREENQVPTVNGIWLHGGGRWKPLPPVEYVQVHSDAAELQGAAHAAGARGVALDSSVVDGALLAIDDAVVPKRLEDWAAWLRAMAAIDQRLAAYPSDAIDLVLTGQTVRTFESRPSDRYKRWRRRTAAEALTE